MKKCLKISMNCKNAERAMPNFIQKKAQELGLEGIVQQNQEELHVYVCGLFDPVDDFVDSLYLGTATYTFQNIEIESSAARDYRGVFRIVE
jgi:hypothetical protein